MTATGDSTHAFLARLHAVTAALSAAPTAREIATIMVEQACAALGASAASVSLLSADGAALDVVEARGYPPTMLDAYGHVPLSAPWPLAEAVRDLEPIWIGAHAEWAARYPHLAAASLETSRAWAAVPLVAGGRALGALGLTFTAERTFSAEERAFALALAGQCAQALERARLYEEARASEARYRTLTESLVEAVYETDLTRPHRPSGVLRYYSDNAGRVLGYPWEAWQADDALFVKGLHPDDRDWVLRAHDELRASGETLDIEYRWVKPDGAVVWIEDRARIERGPGGEPLTLRGTNADITARKQLEQRLRAAEANYRALVERLPDTTCVYLAVAGPESRTTYVSPQIQAIVGYSRQEWQAQPGLWIELLHPEDRERVVAEIEGCFAAGRPFSGEYRFIARDGREVWVRDEAHLVRDETGDTVSMQGLVVDITERKAVERALQASEARFRTIFEQAGIGIALVGADGRLISTNPALERMLGYGPGALAGRSVEQITHPDDYAADLQLAGEVLSGARDHYRLVKRYLRADGGIVLARLTASLVKQANGSATYGIGLVEDITAEERERARREALLRIARRLADEPDPDRVLGALLEEALALLGADIGGVYWRRPDEPAPMLVRSVGMSPRLVAALAAVRPGPTAGGRSLDQGRALVINDYARSPAALAPLVEEGVSAGVVTPLLHEGRSLGLLAVASREADSRFTQQDAELLEVLAGTAAAVLANLDRARLEGALLAARTAAHHLNNSLSLTVGYAEMLAANSNLPVNLRRMAQEALRGAEDAARTLDRLQRIARLEEAQAPLGLGADAPILDLDRSGSARQSDLEA